MSAAACTSSTTVALTIASTPSAPAQPRGEQQQRRPELLAPGRQDVPADLVQDRDRGAEQPAQPLLDLVQLATDGLLDRENLGVDGHAREESGEERVADKSATQDRGRVREVSSIARRGMRVREAMWHESQGLPSRAGTHAGSRTPFMNTLSRERSAAFALVAVALLARASHAQASPGRFVARPCARASAPRQSAWCERTGSSTRRSRSRSPPERRIAGGSARACRSRLRSDWASPRSCVRPPPRRLRSRRPRGRRARRRARRARRRAPLSAWPGDSGVERLAAARACRPSPCASDRPASPTRHALPRRRRRPRAPCAASRARASSGAGTSSNGTRTTATWSIGPRPRCGCDSR